MCGNYIDKDIYRREESRMGTHKRDSDAGFHTTCITPFLCDWYLQNHLFANKDCGARKWNNIDDFSVQPNIWYKMSMLIFVLCLESGNDNDVDGGDGYSNNTFNGSNILELSKVHHNSSSSNKNRKSFQVFIFTRVWLSFPLSKAVIVFDCSLVSYRRIDENKMKGSTP